MPNLQRSAIAFGAILVATTVVAVLRAEEKDAKKNEQPSKLAADLVGTWELTGAINVNSTPMTSLKFFTGRHWNITKFDKDGKVVFHHGGTYKLDGDQYTETIEYANENTADMIGRTFKFKITMKDDTYTQLGVDNSFHEIWKRAK
jgi:hypothetical protein